MFEKPSDEEHWAIDILLLCMADFDGVKCYPEAR
jgi:hypothetical protein